MKVLIPLACFVTLCLAKSANPLNNVVQLIRDLATEIEKDGKEEQASYDKYACWVEKTLQRTASEISAAKETLVELAESVKKLKAEIASHGAEIAQLNKDIAQNNEAQKDAQGIRNKENKEYAGERSESEQCIGALEAAIKVLTGAGEGSKESGFLQQYHEAELMSVAMGVNNALKHKRTIAVLSDANIEVVRRFVQNPGSFAEGSKPRALSAAQVGQNPFGDYAPQSTQIQGILKGMYDAFTADLEKDNAEEANKQKSFEELMATKKQELATLEATLEQQETDKAAKTKQLSEDQTLRDDTTEELAANEKFFEETKSAAEAKATEWSTRTRLRVEELAGMEGAIQILSGGEKVFDEATTTFVQLKAVHTHTSVHKAAYSELQKLAAKYRSSQVLRLVSAMKSGGHFDKVMIMIDQMMKELREEEQDDIEHRDRCENSENANGNEMEDLDSAIANADKNIERLERAETSAKEKLATVEGDISESKASLEEMLRLRNEAHNDFTRALKMDAEAIRLIESATVRLSKYYKENNVPLKLLQAPEYSNNPNKAPETTFSGKDSRQGESTGIVAILDMIKEDLQKEMKEGRADEAEAQAEYEKQSGALQATLDAQKETKVSLEKELAALDEKISSTEKHKNSKQDDLNSEKDMKKSLETDCAWVKDHFKSRREKRKTEMEGLVEAKNFLAGVEAGEPVLRF